MHRIFFMFILFLASLGFAKPPELNPHDTRIKIEEILKAHVSYQTLSSELIKRTFINFLSELDPQKLYFLAPDVSGWLEPSEELVQRALDGFNREDFSVFIEMHAVMLQAIERRNTRIENEVSQRPLPINVKASEFKDLSWEHTEEGLINRLLRLNALREETAEKFEPEIKDLFFQRLHKMRVNREEELIGNSENEKMQTILSHVLKATSSALDSQTAYFTPSEANQFMIQVQQKLFGIGAQLRDDLNGFTIVRILEGSPAAIDNKLKNGDRIIAVGQVPVIGMDISEAVELIRGPQNTPVVLTIIRQIGDGENKQQEMLDVELLRGEIVLKETRLETSHEPFGDGAIGILHLFSFYQDATTSSTTDLRKAIEALKEKHNLKGIILDLRNNGGGFLPQAVSVTGLFIKKGVVVSVKDNTGHTQRLRNIEENIAWDGPLLVLTNRISASAAEIVSQTLQDYGRAIIVGDEETYGKGTFQTFTLEAVNYGKVNPKGEYKVTRGRYYTVSGKSPQLIGVKSDIVIPGIYSKLEIGEKFSKFPLDTDTIAPSFEDPLDDIPSIHRSQISKLYKFNLQPVLNTYTPLISTLQANSTKRLEDNKNYQNFIKELEKKEFVADAQEIFGESDLQLEETIHVMKDLIFLLEEKNLTRIAG